MEHSALRGEPDPTTIPAENLTHVLSIRPAIIWLFEVLLVSGSNRRRVRTDG
jgi:hypothetical protein